MSSSERRNPAAIPAPRRFAHNAAIAASSTRHGFDVTRTDPSRQAQAQRLRGLSHGAATILRDVALRLDRGELDAAERGLAGALALAPTHAETRRLHGLVEHRRGRAATAVAIYRAALADTPGDALIRLQLGEALADLQDLAGSQTALREACAHASADAEVWFRAGVQFDRQALHEESIAAAERVLALQPAHPLVRMLLARGLAATGRTDEAAAQYRRVIASGSPRAWQAWFSLVDLKTVRLEAQERVALERAHAAAQPGSEPRGVLGFALGQVHEDAGRHDDAWRRLAEANAWRRGHAKWDAADFSRQVDTMQATFAKPRTQAASQGGEVVFVVGLPRSGTTLVEQVLAAHPEVEAASELPDLPAVLAQESQRRGVPFPRWCSDAGADDWTRLGAAYLQRTARWRSNCPRSTDKLPGNWLFIGAIRAMLPDARIIDCRRDALETCWSCYKQLFAPGLADYTYDLAELGAYWRDYDRLARDWAARAPSHVRAQSIEALQVDPQAQIRDLLAFCRLPFDAACLRFHEARRNIRTPSAAQVRQPLERRASRAAAYGDRLAQLRATLAG